MTINPAMRVNPNSDLANTTQVPSRPKATTPGLGRDQLTLDSAENLNRALQESAPARPDEVARAATLVQDPDYPPPQVIDDISGLLANHMNSSDPSQPSA
jgi:hypothetical protein